MANASAYDDPRVAELYDVENLGRADHDFYLRLATRLGARCVVDIGCGTGVLAADLAIRGVRVLGLDPAVAMLDVARGRPGGDRVTWLQGYADRLPGAVADLVVMTGHVAQYFVEDAAWRNVLHHAHRALRPGGHLAFESRDPAARAWETWTPELTRQELPHPGGGGFTSWVELVDVDESDSQSPVETHVGHTVLPSGEHLAVSETLTFRSLARLTTDLARAGFGEPTAYGDWLGGPVTKDSRELILVAPRG